MSGHPDCHYCAGSGYRENTLGNMETCWCVDNHSRWYSELESLRKQRLEAQTTQFETEWDLL